MFVSSCVSFAFLCVGLLLGSVALGFWVCRTRALYLNMIVVAGW